jgi:hypothetical protein
MTSSYSNFRINSSWSSQNNSMIMILVLDETNWNRQIFSKVAMSGIALIG